MKTKKTWIIWASVLIILAMFIGCGKHAGEKEYEKATAAMEAGELPRAKTLFEKAILKMSSNENKSVAQNQLGLVHWQLGEIDEAAEAFNQSCNLTESLTGANLNLGIALFRAGRYQEAEVALNNVLGGFPGNPTALATLSLIEMKKRDWAGAHQKSLQALRANPRSPAAQNARVVAELNSSNNTETAIKDLKQIASAAPDYAPTAYNIAVIYDQWLKNSSAAKGWYGEYLTRAGSSGSHAKAAADALTRLGGGQQDTSNPAQNTQSASSLMINAYKLYQAKNYNDAIATYLEAIQIDPMQKDAYYNMALCNCALKKWTDAERAAKALISMNDPRGQQLIDYISKARKK